MPPLPNTSSLPGAQSMKYKDILPYLPLPSEEKYVSHTGKVAVLIILIRVPKRIQLFATFAGKIQSQWTRDAVPNRHGFLMFVPMTQFEVKFRHIFHLP
jgi:hypothetical protein